MANILPLYQSILNELIRQIESGELAENTKLPSEQKLGEMYHVSRITVRRALSELERKQYIYKKQGQGSFVLQKDDADIGIHYLNVRQAIINMGATPKVKLEHFSLLVDGQNSTIRSELGLNADDYLYQMQYMFYADDQPVFDETVYLPFNRFPKIFRSEITNNDLVPFLVKKYGLTADFFTHTQAGLITKDNRQLFQLNVGDPLVKVQTSGIEKQEVIFYSTATVVGDLIMYIIS